MEMFERVYLTYKFEYSPAWVISQGLLKMQSYEGMTKFYKELAKKIHPDKNNHPFKPGVSKGLTGLPGCCPFDEKL